MFDFSGDEMLFFALALVLCLMGLLTYVKPLFTVPRLGRRNSPRGILLLLVPVLLGFTAMVLDRWSDAQVAGHWDYILLFLAGNGAWLTAILFLMPTLGISLPLDAIDRDNPAAMIAICGALSGCSIIYALSNVGGGPTIWTTLIPAGVATVLWVLIWRMTDTIAGGLADPITLDRDIASAARLTGMLVGSGLILGRAVGGNWKSWDQTWIDLARFGWPAPLLGVAAGIFQRYFRPTPANPKPPIFTTGWSVALLLVIAGLLVIFLTPLGFSPSRW